MNEAWDMNKVATMYNEQSPERFALNRILHIIENCASEGLFNTSTYYDNYSVLEYVRTRLLARGFALTTKEYQGKFSLVVKWDNESLSNREV